MKSQMLHLKTLSTTEECTDINLQVREVTVPNIVEGASEPKHQTDLY